ncbi:MAG: endonuclease/exonuclease/phosphatase family protein, partial [Bacteroidaceae bacterium]|nr:endonuclease/exonuclease/phosphatase family protein [Bacteroidaceae bacterium]
PSPQLGGAGGGLLLWNVENFFHPSASTDHSDCEFTPNGSYRWTYRRFMRKANTIAQTIAAAGCPDLIALLEIEDDSTLIALTQRSVMREMPYRYLRTHGNDRRGINIALLYNEFAFRPVLSREVEIASSLPTRNLLYVAGETMRDGLTDTLHIIVCHLPSQASGTRESDTNRLIAAATLRSLADSILHSSPSAALIIAGDFNSGSRSRLIRSLASDSLRHLPFDSDGTYRFRGDWTHLDHIFCSPRVAADTARIFRPDFLLESNRTYGGSQPRRTFRGPSYHGGVSDHLPVVLPFRLLPQ